MRTIARMWVFACAVLVVVVFGSWPSGIAMEEEECTRGSRLGRLRKALKAFKERFKRKKKRASQHGEVSP